MHRGTQAVDASVGRNTIKRENQLGDPRLKLVISKPQSEVVSVVDWGPFSIRGHRHVRCRAKRINCHRFELFPKCQHAIQFAVASTHCRQILLLTANCIAPRNRTVVSKARAFQLR